ncbi:MAG TPA: sensor histidine kinase [Pseudoxanthomonas sp.]|nr:sensor histidine kinase [Pseudoxanthomonas sp.]
MPAANPANPKSAGRDPFSGWRPRSLRARQLLAASLGLVAFLFLAGYALDKAFQQTAQRNMRERMLSFANAYIGGIDFDRENAVIDYVVDTNPPDPRFVRPGSGLYAQVVLQDSHWVSRSGEGPELPVGPMLAPKQETFDGPLPITQIDGSRSEVYRYGRGLIWTSPSDANSEFPITVYIMEDASALGAQLRVFRGALWVYLGSAGVVLLLLQMAVLRWSLRPLNRVVDELEQVQRGQLEHMSRRHPRELEPLTESINALIESEREHLDRQRNTLADLAHSLKTPLAVLRAQLDDGVHAIALRDELDTQLRRMNNLVSYQLARAASGGHKLFAAPLPIEPHAEEIVRGLEKVYAAKRVICEFEIDPAARFHGEPGDLQELMGNLLENAFKWARSRVLLTVAPVSGVPNRRAGLLLAVDDDGPGIADEDVTHVLQRGVRGDERVQGHGIGLAIVQDLIKDYRGELHVGRSPELGGARFEVRLPAGL